MNQEDEILAYKFLSKLDKRKYGHLIDELNNGSIEYPKKLTEAYQMALARREAGKLVCSVSGASVAANPAGHLALVATEGKKLVAEGKKKQHVKQQQGHDERHASTGSGGSNINKSNVKCFFCNQCGFCRPKFSWRKMLS